MATEFTLPELGENIAGGDVVRVLVKPGDVITRDQPVLELETDKATIEVPSSVEGTVAEVRVTDGQKLKVGEVVLTVSDAAAAAGAADAAADADTAAPAGGEDAATEEAPPAESAARDAAPAAAEAAPSRKTEAPAAPAADEKTKPADTGAAPAGPVEFVVPELGENVAGGDVLRVLVKAGD
ncbi:MAG: dihydrolipoyllysine-residue acetyltransferase, partial [Vicinamibacteraceae bacterium]|nr:dihydrolipoyllysine-residue acetyltransferase [Vicinamibacteraceae bacterium]